LASTVLSVKKLPVLLLASVGLIIAACSAAVQGMIEEAKAKAPGTWLCAPSSGEKFLVDVRADKVITHAQYANGVSGSGTLVLDWKLDNGKLVLSDSDVTAVYRSSSSRSNEVKLDETERGAAALVLDPKDQTSWYEDIVFTGGKPADITADLSNGMITFRNAGSSGTTSCVKKTAEHQLRVPTAADLIAQGLANTHFHHQSWDEVVTDTIAEVKVKIGYNQSASEIDFFENSDRPEVKDLYDPYFFNFKDDTLLQVTTAGNSTCVHLDMKTGGSLSVGYMTPAPDAFQDDLKLGTQRKALPAKGWTVVRRTADGTGACAGVRFSGLRNLSGW
jgi:hypothetical protein